MEFAPLSERPGIETFDPNEKARYEFHTPSPVEPKPVSTDGFPFAMDAAVEIRTTGISLPTMPDVNVQDESGSVVASTADQQAVRLPAGTYVLDFGELPFRTYFRVSGALEIRSENVVTDVRFDEERPVRIAVRTRQNRPPGTITVTDGVEDAMRAVSLFGSMLKTTTPDRSFPTLRDHPPLVERGETFSAPEGVEPPETDIELFVPPERERVYPAAPLAAYLGASLEPGDGRLVAGEFEYSLEGPEGYETTVNRTLRQVFFLDCLVRSNERLQIELDERERVESLVDFDLDALFDAAPADRLETYLSVPHERLKPEMPPWYLSADVVPTPDNVELLPFLARDLAFVRTTTAQRPVEKVAAPETYDAFFRAASGESTTNDGSVAESGDSAVGSDVFEVEHDPRTLEQAWAGPGFPLRANKFTVDSLRRHAERVGERRSTLDVQVAITDERMGASETIEERYGTEGLANESWSMDVSVDWNVTTDELTALLESDADVFHYIGHVAEEGFQCVDGHLDARMLDTVGVQAFLLNACRTYEQGMALVERGSYGGVVTLSKVGNEVAVDVGRALAGLLNEGLTLRSSLSVVHDHFLTGYRYVSLGDGGLTLRGSVEGVPNVLRLERRDEETFLVEHLPFLTPRFGPGSTFKSHVKSSVPYSLSGSVQGPFVCTEEWLREILAPDSKLVIADGEVLWSDELDIWQQ